MINFQYNVRSTELIKKIGLEKSQEQKLAKIMEERDRQLEDTLRNAQGGGSSSAPAYCTLVDRLTQLPFDTDSVTVAVPLVSGHHLVVSWSFTLEAVPSNNTTQSFAVQVFPYFNGDTHLDQRWQETDYLINGEVIESRVSGHYMIIVNNFSDPEVGISLKYLSDFEIDYVNTFVTVMDCGPSGSGNSLTV